MYPIAKFICRICEKVNDYDPTEYRDPRDGQVFLELPSVDPRPSMTVIIKCNNCGKDNTVTIV